MRVLLTGGNGLVGRALRRVLAEGAADWRLDAPGRGELDLLDQRAVAAHFAAHAYDLVIHAAATVGGIRANIAHPTAFLAENALMNTLVIEGARKAGVPRFLFLGSSCMYPKDLGRPLAEADMLTAPLEPTNEGYALSKILGVRHCEAIAREHGLAYRSIVPCNLYGPDDHFDAARGHLVAAALLKMHQARETGAETVTIWGDGLARREFLYVDDLARFIAAWGGRLAELPPMLNVGVGDDHAVNDYYAVAAEVVGWSGRFVHDLDAPVGMMRKLMDVSQVQALGWRAMTPLAQGMRAAYRGFVAQLSRQTSEDAPR
ncbi:NAD-dependent epimerase/dehydratase family protein [Siculibacillus lacustris]|uniref:GDP-L-fucose synthase n=1 Tax=Siculibacillus lacustris TaxID=1549641 RepID=A0A4V2KTI9_9HYPH|nr:NAD-dependent epimerase/dehydratase family protein [Siculibacillus lacustris]TBW37401.1 NAD-dependent epimerase/dehydratase family protein [Siculibacillus lacustris]